jgi:RHS repeat-associated protein
MKSQFTRSDTIPPSLTNYMFTGKELDDMTGLYYYGARYYDPRMSVWQSRNYFSILSAKREGVVYNFQPFA